jgi:ABC-type nickel/cobalt efflux system permease component RcnA
LASLVLLLAAGLCNHSQAHDIPNQRVDRSTQATLRPGRLELDYEVSLTELTLTQDLRRLVGSLPGADRSEWLDRYGQVTGPLNAKGFLVHCDGRPILLRVRGFDLVVEEHPRYTFHLEATLPNTGRLSIHDTNYVSSEGTSRLAVRGMDGLVVDGDELPGEVAEIPIRPVWQLSDEEERRTRLVEVSFHRAAVASTASGPGTDSEPTRGRLKQPSPAEKSDSANSIAIVPARSLAHLLDRDAGASWLGLLLIAAALGAAHSLQPGHGKTLVSAVALGAGARWYQPVLLSLVTTLAHTGSVLSIAAGLWLTGASQVAGLHQALSHLAGFAIAAGGFWRIGRSLSGLQDHAALNGIVPSSQSMAGLIGLGLAGGLVPCWDAVGLVVLSAALGKLGTGVLLVIAFGMGMAGVLVAVGLLAARLKSSILPPERSARWEGRLGLVSGVLLALIGLIFFLA